MDDQQLATFIAVAETGSFSGAAERLHLTQPAISKRVALLEQYLGASLFDRLSKRVALTPAGTALLPHARHILQAGSDARRALADLSGTIAGPLRIATSHHIGLHRLPPILRDFSRAYPEVALDLHFLDSEQAPAEILHGSFDIAVVTLGDFDDARLHYLPIWQDELHFVAAPQHPLGTKKSLTLNSLASFQAILPDASTHTTELIQRLFDHSQIALDITMVTNHLDAIKMMVSVGLGWSVLPSTMLDEQLQPLALKHPPLKRSLGIIYHKRRSLSNAAQAFMEYLQNSAYAFLKLH